MPSRFLNNITVNDEYTLPSADGAADQIITTDGAGQLSFVDQSTISAGNAEHVVIYAKNTSGSQIDKGTPVYITGTVGATDTVEIAPADAGNSSHMPAVGLLDDTLANNAFGYVITGGFMDNITTDPIDGNQPASNDTVYVKVGGGLTLTKPTGPTGLIQNIAKVGKVSGGNSGSLIVSSILRSNDVPNLTTGKIWVGDGNTTESTVVHLDETNGRMGIGTTSPTKDLTIESSSANVDIKSTGYYPYSEIRFLNSSGGEVSTIESQINPGSQNLKLTHVSTAGTVGSSLELSGNVLNLLSGTLNGLKLNSGSNSANLQVGGTTNFAQGNISLTPTQIDFRSNYSTAMTINLLGNVGIGTTSPSYKLDVDGTARINDAFTITKPSQTGVRERLLTASVSDAPGDLFFINNGTIGNGSFAPAFGGIMATRNDLFSLGFSGLTTSALDTTSGLFGLLDFAAMLTSNSSDPLNGTLSNVSNRKLFTFRGVNSSDLFLTIFPGGNVNIGGTTDVGYKLDVDGVIRGEQYLRLADTSGTNQFSIRAESTFGTLDNGSKTFNYIASNHLFLVGFSEKMRINSNGNVGIGTTSPSSKLEVDGGIKMSDDTDTASSDKVGTLRYRTSGNNSYVDMCMQTGASTYAWVNIVQNNW